MIEAKEWMKFAENAHLICFNEKRPDAMNRIDYALVVEENDMPLAYMTIKELDSETVYMQYGGAFPSAKNTIKSFQSYEVMMNFLKENYKLGLTLIENTNTAMMKFAMKFGLRVTGLKLFNGIILLEHSIKFKE